jgi:uncharacterized membrane protein
MSSIACMTSSAPRPDPAAPPARSVGAGFAVLTAAGIAYPFLVYFVGDRAPAGVFIALAIVLVLLRAPGLRGLANPRTAITALVLAVAILTLLAFASSEWAVRAYPVLISLLVATAFGASLLHPPPLVERFARLREPDPPPQALAYMRKVTVVWFVFLLVNAALSALTVALGDLALWTFYNGVLSYLLMGLLFAGEFLIRRRLRRRLAASP